MWNAQIFFSAWLEDLVSRLKLVASGLTPKDTLRLFSGKARIPENGVQTHSGGETPQQPIS